MQVRQADALILDVVDLHEKDRIVAFLTAEFGQKRGVARSARTKFSRFAGQLQPLAKVRAEWSEKEGRDLVRIRDAQLIRPAALMQESLEGILLGTYLAEHVAQFAQEDEPSSHFYRLLDSTLEAMLGGVDPDLAARYLEIWVLRLSGILPVPRECPICGSPLGNRAALLENDGAIVGMECTEGQTWTPVTEGQLELLRRSGRLSLPDLAKDPPSVETLRRTEDLCKKVRRNFLQAELRSYRVMKETLSG